MVHAHSQDRLRLSLVLFLSLLLWCPVRNAKQLDETLATARDEKWIPESNLQLLFNQAPENEQLPSADDLRFVGTWNPNDKPRSLTINVRKYELSLKKGGWHYCGLIDASNRVPRKQSRQHAGLLDGFGEAYPELQDTLKAAPARCSGSQSVGRKESALLREVGYSAKAITSFSRLKLGKVNP